MEVIRSRRESSREIISNSSPDRANVFMQAKVKPIKKVQIVYYLTTNGLLEHPHYMEVTHLANQPLRLKDVIDRLIVLRGKGMPSRYSWSRKRSYKNGYVWNDLVENDVIYPTDGAEVVLKGSELVENCSEKFQRLNVNLHSKLKPLTPIVHKTAYEHHQSDDQEEEEQEQEQEEHEEEEEEEKTSYTSSTTSHSRCSRGVSTDELEEEERQNNKDQTHYHHRQTPSSLLCHKKTDQTSNTNNKSKRFDGDDNPADSALPIRNNSVLLKLISCGNLAVSRAKDVPSLKQPVGKKSKVNGALHKAVLSKSAAKVAEEEDMLNYMSENPRFGNFQSEEKEYFSGSIVESASKDEIQPVLKKSNSYNEERRSSKAGLGQAILEIEEEDQKGNSFNLGVKGKCIPRKKSSSSSKNIRQIK